MCASRSFVTPFLITIQRLRVAGVARVGVAAQLVAVAPLGGFFYAQVVKVAVVCVVVHGVDAWCRATSPATTPHAGLALVASRTGDGVLPVGRRYLASVIVSPCL